MHIRAPATVPRSARSYSFSYNYLRSRRGHPAAPQRELERLVWLLLSPQQLRQQRLVWQCGAALL